MSKRPSKSEISRNPKQRCVRTDESTDGSIRTGLQMIVQQGLQMVVQQGFLFMQEVNALSLIQKSAFSLLSENVLPLTLFFRKFNLSKEFKSRVNSLRANGKRIRILAQRGMKIAGLELTSMGCVVSFKSHTAVFDETMKTLVGILKIDALNASSCYTRSRLTDEGLRKIPELKALNLCNSPDITNKGLEHINGENIQAIDVGGNPRITILPDWWHSLTHLSMMNCTGIDNWSFLSKFESLMYLNVGYTSFEMHWLSGMNNLQVLHLNRCHRVSDSTLSSLRGMKKLRILNLINTLITDTGVASLANLQLPSLSSLLLSDCTELSDACLGSLVQIAKTSPLRELNLGYCTGLTKSGIEKSGITRCSITTLHLPW